MNPALVQLLYRPLLQSAAYRVMVGRNRSPHDPERGRFTRADVRGILEECWRSFNALAPGVPDEPTVGSRMNVMLAGVTLSFFWVLRRRALTREYAIELIGDIAWQVYAKWGAIPRFVSRIKSSNPIDAMRDSVSIFLRFPFGPPGYLFERGTLQDGISVDVLRCPVAEYFGAHDAADLCLGTWCNLDYALAELWGGSLGRTRTLAEGNRSCDFRFRAIPPRGWENANSFPNLQEPEVEPTVVELEEDQPRLADGSDLTDRLKLQR